ncbi:hypothetical protein [Tumebacillus sp. BK434]|uniref:hypothetical protein n=1 Tax=Tumebacillus sp. BK434 TaxID=2512169 RepID=UPI00104F5152|nr:hypothetical protein [Tumebacillus sp. BK434]
MRSAVVVTCLCLGLFLTGCGTVSYELPEQMGVVVPSKSWDGTEWNVEADKMSGAFDQLYIGESSDRKGYKVGDEIRIKGRTYVLDKIEAEEKPVRVWLKRSE